MQCSNESAFIDETSLNSMDRIPQHCCILLGSQSGPILSKYLRELRVADFTETVILAEMSLHFFSAISHMDDDM